jgi:hypothetical protein
MSERVLLIRGEFEPALERLESGLELINTYDIGLVRRMYLVWCAHVYALVGRPDTGFRLASQGRPCRRIDGTRALLARVVPDSPASPLAS